MEPESATRRAARFVARKAIPIRIAAEPQNGETPKVTPIDAAAGFTASRLNGRCQPPPDHDPGASVHHRRFEYADHRGVRWLPAQVADAMRHIAPIAQRLAAAGRRRRFADLDLKFPVQNR